MTKPTTSIYLQLTAKEMQVYLPFTVLSQDITTVLCQKGLSDIFCHFGLFTDYDTIANNTSPVKLLEVICA